MPTSVCGLRWIRVECKLLQIMVENEMVKIVDTTKGTKSTIKEEIRKTMNRYHGYTYANQKEGLGPYKK